MGEWVTQRAPVTDKPPDKDLPDVSYGNWGRSSYDLLDGTEIIEDPDTLPGELLDEWFPSKPDVPKAGVMKAGPRGGQPAAASLQRQGLD